ncbi:MAG: restriction endonuclease, partial [Desulfuromonadaceae bacterium]|nr:restriction endonuclease [Desulfuromonadaceae bacterium]
GIIVAISAAARMLNNANASPPYHTHTFHNPRNEKSRPRRSWETWDISVLEAIEWKRFEDVCVEFFKLSGYDAKPTGKGADGGVDILLFKESITGIERTLVQCKHWASKQVGVNIARELVGSMAKEKVSKGKLIITGEFSKDAVSYAEDMELELISGRGLISRIKMLPIDDQRMLLNMALEGDYSTPTCASCGIKMALKKGRTSSFWGCINYPRCKSKIYTRVTADSFQL